MSWAQLFHTDGCHLCERAWALLLQAGLAGEVERREILAQPDWLERYRTRIPVLRRIRDGRELNWPFDRPQLLAFYRETE